MSHQNSSTPRQKVPFSDKTPQFPQDAPTAPEGPTIPPDAQTPALPPKDAEITPESSFLAWWRRISSQTTIRNWSPDSIAEKAWACGVGMGVAAAAAPASGEIAPELEKLVSEYGNTSFDCGEAEDDIPLEDYRPIQAKCASARDALVEFVAKAVADADANGHLRGMTDAAAICRKYDGLSILAAGKIEAARDARK